MKSSTTTQASLDEAFSGAPGGEPAREAFIEALREKLSPGSALRAGEPMAKRTTLRVGGPAEIYFEPCSEEDLAAAVALGAGRGLPLTVLGRGSNLLIRDGGIRGLVISLAHPAFSAIDPDGERIRCGAGARLKLVAVEARRCGIGGFEFLEGIPGSVGGALRMNAGAMGRATFELVERIRVMGLDGRVEERESGEVPVEYRKCPLLKTRIALGAVLKGRKASPEAIAEQMAAFSRKRWESQPAAPSAGCIFKNPATIPAGKLIDDLGLKGTRVGRAVVSDAHGNFIVNEGGATAADVLELIERIRSRARAERGIELETEVQIIGAELRPHSP